MSARRIHEPNLKRYENSTGVCAVAASPADLRRHLEASRAAWQRQVDTDHAYQTQATEAEVSKRTLALKERAKQRLMPTQRALEAAARLQVSLATVGAAATNAYNGQLNAARERDFSDRVASAIGAAEGCTDAINFAHEAAAPGCDDERMACGAPTNETAERVGDVANRLMGYAEQEQNVLIQAGAAATEELRRVAAQASDEVAFVVSKSTDAISVGLQASTKSAMDQISDTVQRMESKVECVMVDTLGRLDKAQETMCALAESMTKCANAATAATQAATEAAEKIATAAAAQTNAPVPTDAMCDGNSVVLYKSHMDILGVSDDAPYNREAMTRGLACAMTKFAACLPEQYDAAAIRAAQTDAMAVFKQSLEDASMPTKADGDGVDDTPHTPGMPDPTKASAEDAARAMAEAEADKQALMEEMEASPDPEPTKNHAGEAHSESEEEKPTGADASEEPPKEEAKEPTKEVEEPTKEEEQKREAVTAAAPKSGFRAIFR